jgi:hypothetical protein
VWRNGRRREDNINFNMRTNELRVCEVIFCLHLNKMEISRRCWAIRFSGNCPLLGAKYLNVDYYFAKFCM